MAIGQLMCHVDELLIDKKYIKFLSSLCGHVDFHIRTLSWSILLKIASTVTGAEKMAHGMWYNICTVFTLTISHSFSNTISP